MRDRMTILHNDHRGRLAGKDKDKVGGQLGAPAAREELKLRGRVQGSKGSDVLANSAGKNHSVLLLPTESSRIR